MDIDFTEPEPDLEQLEKEFEQLEKELEPIDFEQLEPLDDLDLWEPTETFSDNADITYFT